MQVKELTSFIEVYAPLSLQEDYDNAGLICGDGNNEVRSVLLTTDITEAVIDEAIAGGHNLIISHHPLTLQGVKNLVPDNYVKRCLTKAIKNDLNLYSAHTNLDSVANGVSGRMADKLHLINQKVLKPSGNLFSLTFYTPIKEAEKVRNAVLDAGAGKIGQYSRCSFNSSGEGTFLAERNAQPHVGTIGTLHTESEIKTEITVPEHLLKQCIGALVNAHPYEEPVWNVLRLDNIDPTTGFGVIGELETEIASHDFLLQVKQTFGCEMIRHTDICKEKIKKVAVCGGSGAFLTKAAIAAKADIYITGDYKYHDFFNSENRLIIADIGHYESEQFTKEIFYELVTKKLSKFAVQFSKVKTNPINYL